MPTVAMGKTIAQAHCLQIIALRLHAFKPSPSCKLAESVRNLKISSTALLLPVPGAK